MSLHAELTFLKRIFRKHGYPENFIGKCFKKYLDEIRIYRKRNQSEKKKRLLLVLLYLGIIPLQTRTKLQQAFKNVLNCCKVEIALKCQARLYNSVWFKGPTPKYAVSSVVIRMLFMVIYFIAVIYRLLTILVFWVMWIKVFIRN